MAAIGAEIARAYVTVYAKMPGIESDIDRALGGNGVKSTINGHGKSMGAALAGAVGGAVAAVTSKAVGMVMGAIDGAVKRVDIMNNFPKVMQNLGYNAADATKSINKMADSLKGLPTSLSDITSNVQRIAPSFSSLDAATNTALALNNALLAGGSPLQNQANAFEQYSQALGKGKFEMEEWRSLQVAMPGQLRQIAQSLLGASGSTNDLYEAMKSGTISLDDFNGAIVRLNTEGVGEFASFEQQARDATDGIGTGWANLETAITRNLANIIQKLKPMIDAFIVGATDIANAVGPIVISIIDIAVAVGDWAVENQSWLVPALAVVGAIIATVQAVKAVQAAILIAKVATAAWTAASYGAAGGSYAMTAATKAQAIAANIATVAQKTWSVAVTIAKGLWAVLNGSLIRSAALWVTNTSQVVANKVATLAHNAGVKLWIQYAGMRATALAGSSVALVKNTAATVAQKAALLASTVATKAAAIGQRALNLAMSANPIGLIVTAIAALVAGLVWFFTQTEFGKKIWGEFTRFLSEAWANVSSFFKTVWESYLKPVLEALGAIFTWIYENIIVPVVNGIVIYVKIWAAIFTWLWENAVKPAFNAISAIFEWIWKNIISPVIGWIVEKVKLFGLGVQLLWTLYVQPAFAKIGEIFQWIWNTIISPVVTWIKEKLDLLGLGFRVMYEQYIKPAWDSVARTVETGWNTIKGIIDTLVRVIQSDPKKAFEAARDAIGVAWKGIQDLAKAPVRFVIETVINGLIGTINQIPGVSIPKVPLPAGFAAGGVLPGYMAAKRDDVLMPMRSGEGVLVPEVVRGLGPGFVHSLNAVGNTGGVSAVRSKFGAIGAGLARGGLVHPMPGASVTTEFGGYPGHRGIDLAKPAGTPILAAASGAVSYSGWYGGGGNMAAVQHGNGLETRYKHMIGRPIVNVGQFVKQKQVLGYEGSTGDSTGPHLHYEVIKNGVWQNPRGYLDGAGDAGLFDIIAGLTSSVMKQFTDKFPGSDMFVSAAGGLLKQGADSIVEWAKSKLSIGGGGLVPSLYDEGGWLDPGMHLVENRSGRPEPILTAAQWDLLLSSKSGDGIQPGSRLALVLEDGTEFAAYVDERAGGMVKSAFGSSSSGALASRLGGRRG